MPPANRQQRRAAAKQKKAGTDRRVALRITLDGKSWTLHMDDVGPQDDLIARRETGFPVTPFLEQNTFGADSILVIYWMARRKAGDVVAFQDLLDQFPTYEAIGEAGFRLDAIEETDDAGADDDPLPSGGD